MLALSVPVQLTVRKTISPLFMAAGWLVIGLGLWKGLSVLEDLWSQLPGIGLVLFISSLVVAVTKLLKYGTMSSHPLLFEVVRWLSTRTMDKFLWTAIIATYFIFIRGILFRHISTAYLIEWLLFCFIAWRIFAVIKNDLEKSYIVPLNDSGWKKHVQIVDDIMDENFNELVMMQEDYVTGGSRRELMIRISRILENNGLGEEEIAVILQPIIEHSDRAIPWYAWGFIRRRIIGQNYIKRRKTLEDTIHNIAGSLVENKSGSGS
ncbi:MAG: hypothetical protein JXA46_02640 [Dehalococcoidales bacterium]|nr:hypothetical protein [Dehalococcoidales bacterium]